MNHSIRYAGGVLFLFVAVVLQLGSQTAAKKYTAPFQSRQGTAEQQFQAAVAAQQRGNAADATRLYRSLLKAHPDSLPVRVNLAGLLVESSHFSEAIDLYRAGLRIKPSSKELQLGLAYALASQGTPEGLALAAKALEMLHGANPADERTSMLLADSYVKQARNTDALPLLATLEEAHPEDKDIQWLAGSAMLATGRTEEGLRRIDALASATGNADAYLLAGRTRLALQQFDLAKVDATQATTRDPNLPGAQTLLGRALEHLGDYEGSVAALRRAVALDDADYEAHFYLGAVLLFQRDLPGAEKELRRALVLQPGSAEARYKIALLEQAEGKNEAAVGDLNIVIAGQAQWLEPRTTLVALLYKLHRNHEASQAKDAAEKLAATLHPDTPK